MRYECVKYLHQKGFFNSVHEGDTISADRYNKLTEEEKTHFVKDKSDETIEDMIKKEDEESH